MKQICLFLFIFLCISLPFTGNCIAQEYNLITENKIWSTLVGEYDEWSGNPFRGSYFVKVAGLAHTAMGTTCDLFRSDSENMSDWYNYGSLREDSAHKVFYQEEGLSSEYLLYDFGAEKGDTIFAYSRAPNYRWDVGLLGYCVDSVDTISILGIERRRLMLHLLYSYDGGGIQETWISGIGSLSGMPHNNNCSVGCDWTRLLCVNDGDSLFYMDGFYKRCYFSNVGISEADTDSPVKVHPNPVSRGQTIQVSVKRPFSLLKVVIYNALGQTMSTFTMEGDPVSFEIPNEGGLYFLEVMDGDVKIWTEKILVH